jgi:glycosyltransferase involved in cell wall biosynthesis
VIPIGIDLTPFAAPAPPEQLAAWRARLEIGLETPLVLWVGRPVAFKNLSLLLLAFKQVRAILPAARLALVGDMDGTNIPGQIAAHGLQDVVRLPGPVPHAELPALYQTATIYALSSDYEGLGRVLMEAGAAGLAVASTHTHGAADVIVPNLTGLLTPIGDAEALAEAMLRLLRNPARRRAIGEKAQAHVLAAFDYEVLAGRWAGMLRHVARREPPCES